MTADGWSPGGSGGADGGGRLADGRYVAVLDRFEETDSARDAPLGDRASQRAGGRELAVLLLESDDEVVAERAVPAWRLPEDARPDAVMEVSVRNGYVVSMEHDAEATERRSSDAQSRFDGLATRPGEGSEGESGESNEEES